MEGGNRVREYQKVISSMDWHFNGLERMLALVILERMNLKIRER